MTSKIEKVTRMRADTFRATLRLGLGFAGPVHVPEKLKLLDTGTEQLCEALCVDGDLDLAGCTRLASLPERLVVRGRLVLDGCTRIAALPWATRELSGLSAVGCTALASLGSLVECRGDLKLVGCTAIGTLPPALRVADKVVLDGCVISAGKVSLSARLPDTLLAALPGRTLGSLLHHPALVGHDLLNAVIERAALKQDWEVTDVELDTAALIGLA